MGETQYEETGAFSGRIERLKQYAGMGAQGAVSPELLQELLATIEELTLAEEEVRRQNRELVGRTSKALKESEERYRRLVEASPDAVMVVKAGKVTLANKALAELLGYNQAKEMVGLEALSFADEESRELLSMRLGETVPEEGGGTLAGLTMFKKDGEKVLVEASTTHVGETAEVLLILRDVTERKRVQEVLKKSHAESQRRALQLAHLASELTLAEQRERRRLAQALHDRLQQLLAAARLKAGLLGVRAEEMLGGELSAAGRELRAATEELSAVLGECMDESQSLTTELSPRLLYEVGLGAALEGLAGQMKKRFGLEVKASGMEEIQPTEEAALVLLFQAVRELLFNVVKHGKTKKAWLEGWHREGWVQITVWDEGAGFEVERLKGGEGATGSGLGLFGIQERFRHLGGGLKVESSPGKGCRVTLRVRSKQTAKPKKTRGQAAKGGQAGGDEETLRVLVVDDHPALRAGLRALVANLKDVEVVGEAGDGVQALEMAGKLRPQVVLMDVAMPRMDGIEATRRIMAAHPGMRVVGLSMNDDPHTTTMMIEAGASTHLSKAVSAQKLMDAIRGNVQV